MSQKQPLGRRRPVANQPRPDMGFDCHVQLTPRINEMRLQWRWTRPNNWISSAAAPGATSSHRVRDPRDGKWQNPVRSKDAERFDPIYSPASQKESSPGPRNCAAVVRFQKKSCRGISVSTKSIPQGGPALGTPTNPVSRLSKTSGHNFARPKGIRVRLTLRTETFADRDRSKPWRRNNHGTLHVAPSTDRASLSPARSPSIWWIGGVHPSQLFIFLKTA
jgi:hypothetical protein